MDEPFRAYIERELGSRVVLIACGLPASGKTRSTEIAARLKGYIVLRTDILRLEVFKDLDVFNEKLASDMGKREEVYEEVFRMAGRFAGLGIGLVMDATFATQALRRRAARVAVENNMTLVIQETRCPEEVSIRRILARSRGEYDSNALTEQAYFNNKAVFEPVDLDKLLSGLPSLSVEHIVVDTTSDHAEDWAVIHQDRR
ncbi:MAG: AAA family ATPase [Desulfobacteraceae bacterium]